MPKGTVDKVLAQAHEAAAAGLEPIAKAAEIGAHLGFEMDDKLVGTHYFECLKPGYRGWRWAATLTRVPRSRQATLCEVALVPGRGSLLAPPWIPWAERLQPSDVSPGDAVPYIESDERLEGASASSKRVRRLSEKGRAAALKRWSGKIRRAGQNERARSGAGARDHSCDDCGFLMRLAGPVGEQIGVCANEWSHHDGAVVPLEHYCGAHSETDIEVHESLWSGAKLHMDEADLEVSLAPRR